MLIISKAKIKTWIKLKTEYQIIKLGIILYIKYKIKNKNKKKIKIQKVKIFSFLFFHLLFIINSNYDKN